MFTISKEFHFSASHILHGMPEGHPCGRLHGHNYVVIVELSSECLDDQGMVVDYNDLASVKAFIDGTLDHRHLNDVLMANPTAEQLALFIYNVTEREPYHRFMTAVSVKETVKTCATYRPPSSQ